MANTVLKELPLDVHVARQDEGVCVVECDGDLDIASDEPFRRALDEALRDGVRQLILDLRRVPFIDSVAIGHILRAYKRLGHAGRMEIRIASPHTRMLLQIAGLGSITRMLRSGVGRMVAV